MMRARVKLTVRWQQWLSLNLDASGGGGNTEAMPKPTKGPREDVNQAAFRVVAQATGEASRAAPKNAAAVARGRQGGQRGGKARAAKLTSAQRSAIARKAAAARWADRT